MRQCGARVTAQLLRSSKFAGSAECARVRPNCKLNQPVNQPSYPATPKSPLPPPFCIWQFDNNAGALLDTHTQTERDTDTEAQWGKQTIAHCDCDCPMQMKLCSAALMCRVPLPRAFLMTPPLWNTQLNHTQKTQRQRGQHYLSRCGKLI